MYMIIGAIAIAVSGLVMRKMARAHKENADKLATKRADIMVTAIPIICGDCAGREDRPRKTFLRTDPHLGSVCDTCGGSSYALVSEMAVQRRVEAELKRRQSAEAVPMPVTSDLTFEGVDAIVVG